MLFGIIGDIHGNIDALEVTVASLNGLGVDRIVCTGDVVGYGGAPGACVDFLRLNGIACVMGNHDKCTVDELSTGRGTREEAVAVFEWNRRVLSAEQLSWLAALPKELEIDGFLVRHGSCRPFPEWDYVVNRNAAAVHFMFQKRPLAFTGHSHVPVLASYTRGGNVDFRTLEAQTLPDADEVMVGVGAVGQPRDGDPRACTVIYDDATRTVTPLRVPYDISQAQKRIFDAELPESLAYRLAVGR